MAQEAFFLVGRTYLNSFLSPTLFFFYYQWQITSIDKPLENKIRDNFIDRWMK